MHFAKMIKGDATERMMLLEAPSGYGKTFLLRNLAFYVTKTGGLPLYLDFNKIENHNPLFLVNQTRTQLGKRFPPVYFSSLNDVFQRYMRPTSFYVAINVDGELQTVDVNLMLLRANLLLLNEDQLNALAAEVAVDPKLIVGKTPLDRANLLIQIVLRRDQLPTLIEVGRQHVPGVEWWQTKLLEKEDEIDNSWQLDLMDIKAQSLAIDEINEAYRQSMGKIQREKKIIVFLDGVEGMTKGVNEWVYQNLVQPVQTLRYPQLFLVLAGQTFEQLAFRSNLPSTMALSPFSREEASRYLFEKRKINRQQLDFEEIYQHTGGIPLVLSTWADFMTLQTRPSFS